jgi:hypothetical protein
MKIKVKRGKINSTGANFKAKGYERSNYWHIAQGENHIISKGEGLAGNGFWTSGRSAN